MAVIEAVANWHAHQAIKAYRRRDYATYTRHIHKADELRYVAATMVETFH